MKYAIWAGPAMAAALATSGAATAATFFDYVNVLVPGNQLVTFETFGESTETFVATTALPSGLVPGTIILTEPTTGVVSDVLSILPSTSGGVDIFFFSGVEGGPPLLSTIPAADLGTTLATLAETGQIQDVSQYFGGSTTISVQVGSDIEAVIPEPATWAMMLIGVGGIGGVMRRRSRIDIATA